MRVAPAGDPSAEPAPQGPAPAAQGPAPAATGRFVAAFADLAGDGAAVYLVGSPALGDTSGRQSNVDLVAVTPEPLGADLLGRLAGAHARLRAAGRDATVLYTTWDGLAGPPGEAPAVVYSGRRVVGRERLAHPMTWTVLAAGPGPLLGTSRVAVHADPDELRAWCSERLLAVTGDPGRLLWRRHVTRFVLESTRLAHGASTGEAVSLRRAAELALPEASHTGHRVLTDAIGYREGGNTSMYWGPFERRTNALGLAADLLRRVGR